MADHNIKVDNEIGMSAGQKSQLLLQRKKSRLEQINDEYIIDKK